MRIVGAKTAASPRYAYTASGYFDDVEALLKALANLCSAQGVYITLQPCKPELLARAHNRLRSADEMRQAAATNDQQVTRLRWLLVDLDPERPAGISSTEEEHQAALAQAQMIKGALRELGWPDPVEADSGNGAHLLYSIDLPLTEGRKETGLVHRVLKGLAARFDLLQPREGAEPLQVSVDQTVYNPSRIIKLYGTLACKGDHTPERPHRMARLLAVPAQVQAVSREQLEALAVPAPDVRGRVQITRSEQGAYRPGAFAIEHWIAKHRLDVIGPTSWQGGRKWVFRVCPWNAEHTDRSAFIVQHADGSLGAGCHHTSCQDRNWQALRRLYEPEPERVRSSAKAPGLRLVKVPAQDVQEPDLAFLEEVLASRDLTRLLAEAPALAQLSRPVYMQQKQRIKETFGKAINLNDLDAAVAAERRKAESEGGRENQAELLVALAEQQAMFFVDPGGICYARIPIQEHIETHPIHERGGIFRFWLLNSYRAAYGGIPNDAALASAMQTLTASALFSKQEPQPVYVRVGWSDECIYIDLANRAHQVVEISAQGWRVLPISPVCFRRYNGMQALPAPQCGGTLALLDPFLNTDEENRLLAKAWLLGCLHPHGPYPTLGLHGERGSAKTTTAKVLRSVIDPCVALLRSAPKDIQALAVAAANNHIIGLDNLSTMPAWLSDALCRTATGAGDAYRQLYTDAEEVVFNYTKPIIFTGIEEIGTRGDFLDRCLLLHLPAIPDTQRQTEKAFWAAFETTHPLILGALFDAVSLALRNYDQVELLQRPRMADFATWITACEQAILSEGQPIGTFLEAYLANREEAVELEVEASLVGSALRRFMDSLEQLEWRGTAKGLLEVLNERENEKAGRSKNWPGDARALSSRLKRLATSLRSMGIVILWKKVHGERLLVVRKTDPVEEAQARSRELLPPLSEQSYEEFEL